VAHWKANSINYNDYENYAIILDRNTPWEDKKDLYSKDSINAYQKELNPTTKKKDKKKKKKKKGKKTK
jgi:hypothetical protein